MSLQPTPTPVRTILSYFLDYLSYLASIPAILLQALCLFLGFSGISYLLFSSFPSATNAVFVSILTWLGIDHVSWTGNPIPGILAAYALLGCILQIGTPLLKYLFGVEWNWGWKKVILSFVALSGTNCLLMAIGLARSGRTDFDVPLFILFLITCFAIVFAAVVGKTFEMIEEKIKI